MDYVFQKCKKKSGNDKFSITLYDCCYMTHTVDTDVHISFAEYNIGLTQK